MNTLPIISETIQKKERPIRIVQFGQGNFLRAFCDDMIDRANEAGISDTSVVVLQFHGPANPAFRAQSSIYTVLLRGKEHGAAIQTARAVTCLNRVVHLPDDPDALIRIAQTDTLEAVISNATEAGVVYVPGTSLGHEQQNFPALLTSLLWYRYSAYKGDRQKGLVILPCELIEDNGNTLHSLVLRYAGEWSLDPDFSDWIFESCLFCNTLVDRIVTGYPKTPRDAEAIFESIGYRDDLLTVAEPFALWVIASDDIARVQKVLPLRQADLPVLCTNDITPYRMRKVRILNGAHTAFVPAAFLAGESIVRDCMRHPVIRPFIDTCIYHEIIPTLTDILPKEELTAFADAVCERFDNPYIDHALLSIALNSVSKWKARVLPSILDAQKKNILPHGLCMSFAALCALYAGGTSVKDGCLIGHRIIDGVRETYEIRDDPHVLAFFSDHANDRDVCIRFARQKQFWDMDLTEIPGFAAYVGYAYDIIQTEGIQAIMESIIHEIM